MRNGNALLLLASLSLFTACTQQSVVPSPTESYSNGAGTQTSAGEPAQALKPQDVTLSANKVLLYNADPSGASALKNGLVSTGQLAADNITLLTMTTTPPSLDTLKTYQCVIAWTNSIPPNPSGQGNRLKEYVDAGGRAVLTVASYANPSSSFELQGGIMQDGYSPLDATTTPAATGARSLNTSTARMQHPLLQNVSGIAYTQNFNAVKLTLDPGATLVGSDDLGVPLLAVNAAANVVGVGIFPSFSTDPGFFNTLANACAAPSLIEVTNTVPTAPGKPALKTGSVTPNNTGTHTMQWTAASDTDGDTLAYTLQHKNAAGSFTDVAGGTPSALERTLAEAEGTWVYQVKANDGTGDGPFSAASDPVVVDKTAPSTPTTATLTGTPINGWYKDTTTVSFSGSTDPDLADGSAPSGNVAYLGGATFNTSGSHPYEGKAKDAAGNISTGALSGTVNVDALAPTVTLTCPTSVTLGSVAYATWTAADEQNGSGVAAGMTSGQILLDTNTITPGGVARMANAAAGTAKDNVGHDSAAVSCGYKVEYAFTGFFQPVDMGLVNTVKAGSAIPVKFNLGGNQGTAVVASGWPRSVAYPCAAGPTDAIEETTTAGSSSLSYDFATGQYVYVWKTDKAWASSCRQLEVKLADGRTYVAKFNFSR